MGCRTLPVYGISRHHCQLVLYKQKSLAEQHSCPCTPINYNIYLILINGTNIQINILIYRDFVMMLVLYVLKASVHIRVPLSCCHRPITKLLCLIYIIYFAFCKNSSICKICIYMQPYIICTWYCIRRL